MRKTPVVMGVLSIVFGSIQVLVSAVSLVSAPFSKQMTANMGKAFSGLPRREGEPDIGPMFERIGKLTEELKLYTYLTGFAMLALSITLIIVGWLLYKRRAQARKFTIAWAGAALAYLPVQLWVQVKIIQPRMMEATKQMMASMDPNASGFFQAFSGVQGVATVIMYVLAYTPFPILLLCLIGRPSAKDDLAPAA
jgi:NADH:ubiquinone oxidoreductase subunit 5 (subunit L)/multisubunit Na+/H+ antiporter MnhA subunit